jgi:uncharacterized protein (UPF0264 family)
MQLLVSVRDSAEARCALDGGADIIDAKEPRGGALGAVSPTAFTAIVTAVDSRRSVSAALGDVCDEQAAERDACDYARAGATFVKIGFCGIASEARVESLIGAAARGAAAGGGRLVAVAYADYAEVAALSPHAILNAALCAGAHGVLLDTVRKDGPALFDLPAPGLASWVSHARSGGLFTAVAGRLGLEDLSSAAAIGADIVGVRGAACDGGRDGVVSAAKVRELITALRGPTPHRSRRESVMTASRRSADQR